MCLFVYLLCLSVSKVRIKGYVLWLRKVYGRAPELHDYVLRLEDLIRVALEKTGRRAVVLIDGFMLRKVEL